MVRKYFAELIINLQPYLGDVRITAEDGEIMEFELLKSEIKAVAFEAVREESVDYFEAVLIKKDLADLVSRLDKFFGAPVAPSKEPLPAQAQAVISEFGDIMAGQTLYFWSEGSSAIFAMLWPWGDKDRSTLKMGQVVISTEKVGG